MKTRRRSAFSLIEIMVSVTLLLLIVAGLLVVFNYTTRALRSAHNSTDVFEGARALVTLVSRDFSQMSPAGETDYASINLFITNMTSLEMISPDGTTNFNRLSDVFFIARQTDGWIGTGYFVDRSLSDSVGTLYRFDVATNGPVPHFEWIRWFTNAAVGDSNVHRVADGVVHFHPKTYDIKGRFYWEFPFSGWLNTSNAVNLPLDVVEDIRTNVLVTADGRLSRFQESYIPAFVEIEIGILEPEATRKFNAIGALDSAAAQNFLTDQIGKVHLFRQRVAIRNHIQPPAFD